MGTDRGLRLQLDKNHDKILEKEDKNPSCVKKMGIEHKSAVRIADSGGTLPSPGHE
jgi:hypothetical protein